MTDGNAGGHWPGTDERSVVEDMIRNKHSKNWEECRAFVKQHVYVKAKNNILTSHQDVIIQEVMVKIVRYLPGFRFHCSLKTWLNLIIEHYIIDVHRNLHNEGRFLVPLGDSSNENDRESDASIRNQAWSAENVFMVNEELRNAIVALLEYANSHSNPTRDQLIISMVIFDGHSYAEAAKAAGCSAPVVGYVVREAQRYAREKMEHKP